MTWALYAILAVPLAAVLATLVDGWRLARAATVVAGLVSLGLSIAIAIEVDHGRVLDTAHGWLRIDSLGAVFLLATGLLYATAGVFSIGYLGVERARPGFAPFAKRYFALLNLFGWTMLLVAIDRTHAALEASWKYVLIASCGLGIALLSIILLYATGTHVLGSAYVPRFARFIAHAHGLSADAVRLAFVLALVGFGTKVGFVPVHTWLPDAHSEAPAPVSALLSGALLAAAFYAILRFFQVAVAAGERTFAEHALIVFGVVSLVAASFFVLRQGNYKRLLAYSSIEHMGIIALGVGFGAPLAVAGALLHVITHASAKGLAFFGAGSLLRGYGTKEVEDVTNAGRRMPWTGPMFLTAALALSGLPLSGVFRSEFQIVMGGFAHSQYIGVALLLVFVNLAFFGVIWHSARMVIAPASSSTAGTGAPTAALVGGPADSIGQPPARVGEPAVLLRHPAARVQKPAEPARERSVWMIAAMLGCLFVVVALGVHLPGDLVALLDNARERLAAP
jgi:hydrogenase-4 component F